MPLKALGSSFPREPFKFCCGPTGSAGSAAELQATEGTVCVNGYQVSIFLSIKSPIVTTLKYLDESKNRWGYVKVVTLECTLG